MNWFYGGLSLLYLLLFVAGMAVSIVNRRVSRFTTLLTVGFALGAVAWVLPFLFLLVADGTASFGLGILLYATEWIGNLVAAYLIVGGLFAVLRDVRRRLDQLRVFERLGDDYGRRFDYAGEPPAALPRNPGRPDIQR
jgi:hypothetical protein